VEIILLKESPHWVHTRRVKVTNTLAYSSAVSLHKNETQEQMSQNFFFLVSDVVDK